MSALPGYDLWKTTDEAYERAEREADCEETAVIELRCDPDRLREVDEAASERMEGDEFTELFSILADASECGLITRLADGTPVDKTNALQLDTFSRLARLADRVATLRDDAVLREVRL